MFTTKLKVICSLLLYYKYNCVVKKNSNFARINANTICPSLFIL